MSEANAWEVEVAWRPDAGSDPRAEELRADIVDWTGAESVRVESRDLYFLDGPALSREDAERAARCLLSDPVTQEYVVRRLGTGGATRGSEVASSDPSSAGSLHVATIIKKPGVMEPVEGSLIQGLEDLNLSGLRARTASRAIISGAPLAEGERRSLAEKVLSNPVIEQVFWDEDPLPPPFTEAADYELELVHVRLDGLTDDDLMRVSRDGLLSLSLREMHAIRDHFREQGRDPTDIELETIAQTWSEHCCHKTLTAGIEHRIEPTGEEFRYGNLLRETIARVTEQLRAEETSPFCLSVFKDNAGVVAFDEHHGVSFKVETHNHPSAIEPYGGAGTGIGGVLRDTLGTGLGAKPIVNTDVFCFGPPDLPREALPPGTLHPLRVLRGVVAGVRDYGNRMGIPTASGALYFDDRYVGNPLVYCGSVGLIPRDAIEKQVCPGDRIVALGGRTGRDGIHGATFSSVELTEESETASSGAVQIGNAITEKKFLDVLIAARDRGLYRAVTDCGAGGFSSAVGEMGEETGARVELHRVPLKYEGLSYWEIWISEAQERMVLAVPPEHIEALMALARSEDVECTDIGEFTDTGRLELRYEGHSVGDLDMRFLHHGRPTWTRPSVFRRPPSVAVDLSRLPAPGRILRGVLAAPNVASKEWVIRQYDHEVQGRSVLKPLQGVEEDGPGDAVAFAPVFGSPRGVVLGCGMNPCYGDLDPYRMAASAVDEAVRNVVAVGGDPDRTAILDNFCWGSTDRPEALGGLVEAARGCSDAALALGTPFISGKDSLNNDYRVGDEVLSIPPSLLISSLSIVEDTRSLVSMDLKAPGNRLVIVGETRAELGGSHLLRVHGLEGGVVPAPDARARDLHRAVHRAIRRGLVLGCHDLSEGGLAVAAAEMAFSGGVGAEIRLADVPRSGDCGDELTTIFSESCSRYLIEVAPDAVDDLLGEFQGVQAAEIGETVEYRILRVVDFAGETYLAEALEDLKRAWQTLLRKLDRGSPESGAGVEVV